MKPSIAAGVLAMALCMLAPGAQAQEAYTAKTVNLRAGPGPDYPIVVVLPPGSQVWVQSCVEDYSWCDVVAGPERGWVYAGNIQSYYDAVSGYVPLYYGAWFGIAAYPFFIDDYWPRYYHNRPWYPQLYRWAGHRPPARIHPPPTGLPAVRPGFGRPGQPPHWPGPAVGQPHTPGAEPMQPNGPGAGGGQRGAPIGAPRQPYTTGTPRLPSVTGAPSPGGHRPGSAAPAHHGARGAGPTSGGRGAPPSGGAAGRDGRGQ